VHPAQAIVEPLVDEELAPGGGAVGVEAFAAGDLLFGAEEEAGVRVDEQEGAAIGGDGGRDRDAVGAGRVFLPTDVVDSSASTFLRVA
jgi:hypothetical protein